MDIIITCRIKNIWDNDKNVHPRVFEHIVITYWKQSMINTFDEPKF